MQANEIRENDTITVLKWPEKEEIKGRVLQVLKGSPADWVGVYYEVLTGTYTGHRLFAFGPQILRVHLTTVAKRGT
jgi:hypothetical protein